MSTVHTLTLVVLHPSCTTAQLHQHLHVLTGTGIGESISQSLGLSTRRLHPCTGQQAPPFVLFVLLK